MGFEAEVRRVLDAIRLKFPEFRDKLFLGEKFVAVNTSAPAMIVIPGGGQRDRIVGAMHTGGRVPQDIRARLAAGSAVIMGKDYTDAEGWLHVFIAALHKIHFGRVDIGDATYINDPGGELSKYGPHFKIFFWVRLNVTDFDGMIAEVTVTEAEAQRDEEIPTTLPPNLGQ